MKQNVLQIVKASCAAVVFALVYALIFTLIVQLFCLPSGAIKPTNQVFKILSIVFGGLLFIRNDKGLVKGAIVGVVSVLLNYFLFSAIAASITFSWLFLVELLLGAVAGAITGVLAVSLIK